MHRANSPKSVNNLAWLCLVLLTLVLSFGLSWLILVPLDFAYEWFYSLIEIEQHITKYGPANRLKNGFELTTEIERLRLFSGIVSAIHQQGLGLESLQYHNAQGAMIAQLLTQDEVVHLQDVAVLIDRMKASLITAAILFIGLLFWVYTSAQRIPAFREMLLSVMAFLGFIIVSVLLIGPHKVFYTLHVWVFPEEHKWFFYYEESLMSTMMKAPDLFAYIAILLLVIAIPIFIVIMWLIRRIMLRKNHEMLAS